MNADTIPDPVRECQICHHHQTHWAWRACKRVDCPVDFTTMTHIPTNPVPPPPPYQSKHYLTYEQRRRFILNRGLSCPYCPPNNAYEIIMVDEGPWQVDCDQFTQKIQCTNCRGIWHEVYRLTNVLTEGQHEALYPTPLDSTPEQNLNPEQGVLAIQPHERTTDPV